MDTITTQRTGLSSRVPPLRTLIATLLLGTSLAGCSNVLSESGPRLDQITQGGSILTAQSGPEKGLSYALVRIDASVVAHMPPDDSVRTFTATMTSAPAMGGGIAVGDLVGVTIFESGAGGLFIPAEPGTRVGNSVTFPNQQVDSSGNIIIPFAGNIRAAGMTPQSVSKVIEARLSGRALDPQAIVSVTERRSDAVSVTGDISNSTHFSLDPGGERILSAVARAGGPKFPAYETEVTVQRDGRSETALLSAIMADPAQNIQVHPGDSIYISHKPRYFLALGALGPGQYLGLINRRLSFDDNRLSLADGIAKVGGLEDDRADAKGVFLYREESKATLASMGVAVTDAMPDKIPTIYLLDVSQPAGYFYAQGIALKQDDIIYVSNAPSSDLTKVLNLVLPVTSAVYNLKH